MWHQIEVKFNDGRVIYQYGTRLKYFTWIFNDDKDGSGMCLKFINETAF